MFCSSEDIQELIYPCKRIKDKTSSQFRYSVMCSMPVLCTLSVQVLVRLGLKDSLLRSQNKFYHLKQ